MPILCYVQLFSICRQELLDTVFNFVLETYDGPCARNFSTVLQIVLALVQNMGLKDQYSTMATDHEFFTALAKCPENAYSLGMLRMYFDKEVDFLHCYCGSLLTPQNLRLELFGAYFAAALSCELPNTRDYILCLVSLCKTVTLSQLGTIARAAVENLRVYPVNPPKWLFQSCVFIFNWLLSTEASLRRSAAELIYLLVPSFPKLGSMGESCVSTDKDKDRVHMQTICNKLVSMRESICRACIDIRPRDEMLREKIPTATYYELLGWCIYHQGGAPYLLDLKELFVQTIVQLGSSATRIYPILDMLRLLALFLDNATSVSFFDSQTLSVFLSSMDGLCSRSNDGAIIEASGCLFNLIAPVAQVNCLIIAKSKLFQYSLQHNFGETSGNLMNIVGEITNLVMTRDSAVVVAGVLFKRDVFSRYLDNHTFYFLNTVKICFQANEEVSVDLFDKENCYQIIANSLNGSFATRTSVADNPGVQLQMSIMALFCTNYKKYKSGKKKWLFAKNTFVEFWKSNFILLQNFLQWVQMSSVPESFGLATIETVHSVLQSDPEFIPYIEKLYQTLPQDFFVNMHRSCRSKWARSTAGLCRSFVKQNFAVFTRIAGLELDKLLKSPIEFETAIYYLQFIENQIINVGATERSLDYMLQTVCAVLSHTDDLQFFRPSFAQATLTLAANLNDCNSVGQWLNDCVRMVKEALLRMDHQMSEREANTTRDHLHDARVFVEDALNFVPGGREVIVIKIESRVFERAIDVVEENNDLLNDISFFQSLMHE